MKFMDGTITFIGLFILMQDICIASFKTSSEFAFKQPKYVPGARRNAMQIYTIQEESYRSDSENSGNEDETDSLTDSDKQRNYSPAISFTTSPRATQHSTINYDDSLDLEGIETVVVQDQKAKFISSLKKFVETSKKRDNFSYYSSQAQQESKLDQGDSIGYIIDTLNHDVRNLIQFPQSSDIPFYVTDRREDLISHTDMIQSLPERIYQQFMAAGGDLTSSEYRMFKMIELEADRKGRPVEDFVRSIFIQNIKNDDMEKIQALINIDSCLRYQSLLQYIDYLHYGPLASTTFEYNLTGLHYAVMSNNPDIIKLLIDQTAIFSNSQAYPLAATVLIPLEMQRLYRPTTPLDYAMISRQMHRSNPDELAKSSAIIETLLQARAKPISKDPKIQLLIDGYMDEAAPKLAVKPRLTMYQSMTNLFTSPKQVSTEQDTITSRTKDKPRSQLSLSSGSSRIVPSASYGSN